jgi:hypothetical protein
MTKQFEKASQPQVNYPAFNAYYVPEGGAYWTKVGAAWPHGNGFGFTLNLDLVPAEGGRVILRKYQKSNKESA